MTRLIRKGAVVATPVVASTVMVLMAGVLVPLVGWLALLAWLVVLAVLLAGGGEATAARVLLGAREPHRAEVVTLGPTLELLHAHGSGPDPRYLRVQDGIYTIRAAGTGRRTVMISDGLIAAIREGQLPPAQAAAVIAHATGVVRSGATRNDLAVSFWTLPFQFIAAVAVGIGSVFAGLPLVSLVWRGRFVVGIVALAQGIEDGSAAGIAVGVMGAGIIALTYAAPFWARRWGRTLTAIGDRWVQEVGMSEHLSAFLRRCPPTPDLLERILDLDPPRMVPQRAW